MSSHVVEPKSDVEGHINNIKKILEIKDQKRKHFSHYCRNDEESIEVTLAMLEMTYSDFKKTIYNLEISDYLYSVKDKINTYGLLPVFLVKIKEIIIYIKLGIKESQLVVHCFSFHKEKFNEYNQRPYRTMAVNG